MRVPFGTPYLGFHPDSRGNSIETHLVTKRTDQPDDPCRWLYVRGPEEAMTQLDMIAGASAVASVVPSGRQPEFNHRRQFAGGMPPDIMPTVQILKRMLSLPAGRHLDFALAMDWYKSPDPELDPTEWPNTAIGELINRSKYRRMRPAADELLELIVDLVQTHPMLRRSKYLATVPGHNADGSSFGEALAVSVASRTGKALVRTGCPSGPRSQQKEGPGVDLENLFEMSQSLDGEVMILDDVYRSGNTMNAVAGAARRAGAQRVYGLAAVRTMRR